MSATAKQAQGEKELRGLPRSVELVCAALGIVALLPLMAVLGVLVAATSRGPVLFRQTRIGRHGKPFLLVKFRSMRVSEAGAPRVTRRNDPRITWVGRWLRSFKLDELPQLWNVLKGEMSVVGPRPEVPEYVDLEDPRWRFVLCVRPGLTDPTTLLFRQEEALLEEFAGEPEDFYRERLLPYKLRGYAAYLRRRTWRTDIAAIFRTAMAVIVRRSAPAATIEEIDLRQRHRE